MTYLLSLNKIVKNFGAVQALKGVSLDLNAGEILGLVGDNGAGKSTLIKTLSGVIFPDSGVITLGGEPVVFNLFLGHEELFKNIKFPRILAGFRMQRAAIDLLHSLSINLPSVRRRVEQLSGGQRQAVAIARSLARDPKIILLDEPTAALGAAQRRDLIHLMRKLRERGLGVIFITHNLNEVMEVADRVVVLRQGLAISSAPIQEITESSLIAVITGISDELSIKKAGSKK
jgi:D-xylose transport system ATP-binding protein